jgi:hypothetical protein
MAAANSGSVGRGKPTPPAKLGVANSGSVGKGKSFPKKK